MKSKVILFCVLLFCSKIVDSNPHSENHVRQRANPLSNWQVNKNAPNAQYLDTDFTQTRSVNSAIQQENHEDFHSNQRGYNYDNYGYNNGLASSPSAKELLVNYDSSADERRLDSYPPRVESYPSHTSQIGFDHQQYINQKWRSQNPFTNSVPSSIHIPNDEMPLVNSVQEPYRGPAQYLQPKYKPSSNRGFYQPGMLYPSREHFQYPSIDQSGDKKYVVNPASRVGSRGPIPYENHSAGQAIVTRSRPTGVHRNIQHFESPSEIINETPVVNPADSLAGQSENLRYPTRYENHSEGQAIVTRSRPTGVHRNIQHFESPSEIINETPVVNPADSLAGQSENLRYPTRYENHSEGQAIVTRSRPTGVHRNIQHFESPSEIINETPAVDLTDGSAGQSENIRYPTRYENHSEGQAIVTKSRLTGVHRNVQNFESPSEIINENLAVEPTDSLSGQSENIRYPILNENHSEGQAIVTRLRPTGVRRNIQHFESPSAINNETPAVDPADSSAGQPENIRYPTRYENHSEGQAIVTKSRSTGVHRNGQNFESPSEIINENPAVEPIDGLSGQSENIRYPIPYENHSEGQAIVTRLRPTLGRRNVQHFESLSGIINETPAVVPTDSLVGQSENIRYPTRYDNQNEGQAIVIRSRSTGVHSNVQDFESTSEILNENPAVEPTDSLSGQFENIRYPKPHENHSEGQITVIRSRPTGVHRNIQNFETPSEIINEARALESPDTLVGRSKNIRYPIPDQKHSEAQAILKTTRPIEVHKHVRSFEAPSEKTNETPAVESPESLVDQSENTRYRTPFENHSAGQAIVTRSRPIGVRRHKKNFETPSEKISETPSVESSDSLAGQSKNIKYVENSREVSHLSHNAPITSPNDGFPVKSETEKAPLVNVKKVTFDEISKILPHEPQVRKYAHRLDSGWTNIARDNSYNVAPTDITETVVVKEGKYETNYAEEKSVPITTYPEDAPTPTNTLLENSGSNTYDESNVPQYGSSSPNTSKQDSIHQLTSGIKELSLKSLVANPEVQNILARTDKRFVVIHSNGSIEYFDKLPLDSHQDSKLRLVHTKPKNIDGSEGDGVLTAQSSDNLPSNIAKTPAPVDEHPQPMNNQPVDLYDLNHVLIPLKNLPAGHSHLKSLLPLVEPPADSENSKPLPPPVKVDIGNSKPLIQNEDQSVDNGNLKLLTPLVNKPEDDDNSKLLTPNGAQLTNNVQPKPKNPAGDDDRSKLLLHDVNQAINDDILKHLTSPENQQSEDDDNSKPLVNEGNQSNDNINLTPHARKPVSAKIHKHSYVKHTANHNTFKPLLPNEVQPSDNRKLPAQAIQPEHDKTSKNSYGNEPENPSGDDADSNRLRPNLRHSVHYVKSTPSSPVVNQTEDDNNSESFNKNLSGDDIIGKRLHSYYKHHKKSIQSHANKPVNDNNPEPLDKLKNQSEDDNTAKPLPSKENPSGYNKSSKPLDTNEHLSENDNNFEPLPRPNIYPTQRNKSKSKHLYGNQHEDDSLNSASENQQVEEKITKLLTSNKKDVSSYKKPGDDNISNENQSEEETNSSLSPQHKKPRAHNKKSKQSHVPSPVNQPADDNYSESSKPLPSNQSEDGNSSNLPPSYDQPGDEPKSTSLHKKQRARRNRSRSKHSRVNQPADDDAFPKTQPADNISTTLLTQTIQSKRSGGNQPANNGTPLPVNENDTSNDKQPEDSESSNPLLAPEKQSADNTDSKFLLPNKRRPAHRNKSKRSNVNKPEKDNNSNPEPIEENHTEKDKGSKPLSSYINTSGDEAESTPSRSHKKQRAQRKKSKHSHIKLELDDGNLKPSYQDENQPRGENAAKPLLSKKNESRDEAVVTSLRPQKKHLPHHKKLKHSYINKSVNVYNSETSSDETQPEDDENTEPLPPSENLLKYDTNSELSLLEENLSEDDTNSKPLTSGNIPTDTLNTKPTSSDLSKNNDNSKSTTLSPTIPNTTTPKPQAIKTHKRKHSHRKTTTNLPVVTTTLRPDDSSEDQIITLSPIEQMTDNVSDVPTLTTTTEKNLVTVQTPYKRDTNKGSKNKPDEDQDDRKSSSEDLARISDEVQTYSTTVIKNSSTLPTDNSGGKKPKVKFEDSENTNNETIISNENSGTDNIQTAEYNSSELLDTNTDDPEKSDDYSPITTSPSVHNDVNTSDTFGDNSSELEQFETDVTITVSGSTDNDSEDDIIIINIEVSESTDSPSIDKALVFSIDTNPDNDDESNTAKTGHCKKDHDHDDGRGETFEIDLSNKKGEPTMWIRTTNHELIDKLTAQNDTEFDVVYFFSIENQPIIEREKETTIFCNGTVIIEHKEITYAHKDDPSPTIDKTTEIMQIEDYEAEAEGET